jgi:hypothetical protein
MGFDIDAAIANELRAGTDFYEISGKVLACVPAGEREAVLRRAMPLLTKRIIRDLDRRGEVTTAKRVSFRRRDDAPVEWKGLIDCTARDLRRVAADQRRFAEQPIAWAQKYDHLADALDQQGARSVSDLDPDLVKSILT